MLKSIYTPLSGAVAQEKVMDIIANNLANMNTVGFKGEAVTFKLLEPEPEKTYVEPLPPANYKISLEDILPLRGNEVSYVGVSGVSRDFSQGSPLETKNPLDLMIEGEGFFSIHTHEGVRYTRSGDFTLNQDGALVDKQGFPVLGEKGNVFLHGHDIQINPLGEVYQDGELIDRLKIVTFKDLDNLERVGTNNFFHGGLDEDVTALNTPTIRQGYLEASNVNAIKTLTTMILAHRTYEAYQQSIKNYDSMMDKSSNRLGEVRG